MVIRRGLRTHASVAFLLGVSASAACGLTTQNPDPSSGSGSPTSGQGGSGGAAINAGGTGQGASSGTGGGATGGAGGGSDEICVSMEHSIDLPSSMTIYVVDRSASMWAPIPGGEGSVLQGVVDAVVSCSHLDASGLVVFPDETGCVDTFYDAAVPSGGMHFYTHAAQLALKPSTASGAPLLDAMRRAYEVLQSELQTTYDLRRVVLFTDGGLTETPICAGNDDWELLLEEARNAHEAGVNAVIVALPGSSTDVQALGELSEAFGCELGSCFFDLSRADEQDCTECQLCDIADPRGMSLDITCSFPFPPTEGVDYATGEVTLTTFDPRTSQSATLILEPDQWWVDETGPSLELRPEACELIGDTTSLSATFRCP